jgi:hypothetical protein
MQEIVQEAVDVITPSYSSSLSEIDHEEVRRRRRHKCKKIVVGIILFVILTFGYELALDYVKNLISEGGSNRNGTNI